MPTTDGHVTVSQRCPLQIELKAYDSGPEMSTTDGHMTRDAHYRWTCDSGPEMPTTDGHMTVAQRCPLQMDIRQWPRGAHYRSKGHMTVDRRCTLQMDI